MNKKCFVPSCLNVKREGDAGGVRFVAVPQNSTIRQYWFSAVGLSTDRDNGEPLVCCETHFDMENDARNWTYFQMMGGEIFIKPGIVPHKNVPQNVDDKKQILKIVTELKSSDELCKDALQFEFKESCFVPDELNELEQFTKSKLFGPDGFEVQYHRLHCTACNCHLGSAPIGFHNRYIHPLLKVLICRSCYYFYYSDEFFKDKDGSEIYCRWCGQGGDVMCCTKCPFVFCEKCIKQNLGDVMLDRIHNNDDWICFGCNPKQVIDLKVICFALFEYVRSEIEVVRQSGKLRRLRSDFALCCKRDSPGMRCRSYREVPDQCSAKQAAHIRLKNSHIEKNNNRLKLYRARYLQFGRKSRTQKNPTSSNSVEEVFVPEYKHSWFEDSMTTLTEITGKLTLTANTLKNDFHNSNTYQHLTNIHDKLQKELTESEVAISNLKKELRTQFVAMSAEKLVEQPLQLYPRRKFLKARSRPQVTSAIPLNPYSEPQSRPTFEDPPRPTIDIAACIVNHSETLQKSGCTPSAEHFYFIANALRRRMNEEELPMNSGSSDYQDNCNVEMKPCNVSSFSSGSLSNGSSGT